MKILEQELRKTIIEELKKHDLMEGVFGGLGRVGTDIKTSYKKGSYEQDRDKALKKISKLLKKLAPRSRKYEDNPEYKKALNDIVSIIQAIPASDTATPAATPPSPAPSPTGPTDVEVSGDEADFAGRHGPEFAALASAAAPEASTAEEPAPEVAPEIDWNEAWADLGAPGDPPQKGEDESDEEYAAKIQRASVARKARALEEQLSRYAQIAGITQGD
jgi:hypothetical protein